MIDIGKKLTEKERARINRNVPTESYSKILQEEAERNTTEMERVLLKRKKRSDKGLPRSKYDPAIPLKMRSYIGRANKKGFAFSLTVEEFNILMASRCCYCGSSYRITIDRKDSSLGYTQENVQPCCLQCNTMKLDYDEEDFLKQVLNIYRHRLASF